MAAGRCDGSASTYLDMESDVTPHPFFLPRRFSRSTTLVPSPPSFLSTIGYSRTQHHISIHRLPKKQLRASNMEYQLGFNKCIQDCNFSSSLPGILDENRRYNFRDSDLQYIPFWQL